MILKASIVISRIVLNPKLILPSYPTLLWNPTENIIIIIEITDRLLSIFVL